MALYRFLPCARIRLSFRPNRFSSSFGQSGQYGISITSDPTVTQERLNDAAIALHEVLLVHNIKFGIFGGYAISALGGPRVSKNIDCIASVDKSEILEILDQNNGFEAPPEQEPEDYVAFLWSDKPSRERVVAVEVFCERFSGWAHSLPDEALQAAQVTGETQRSGIAMLLDPVYLFKGKLRAAARRHAYSDATDLRWLEGNYLPRLQRNRDHFSPLHIGLALKRYPDLEYPFSRIGLDLETASAIAAPHDPDHLPPTQTGALQTALLG